MSEPRCLTGLGNPTREQLELVGPGIDARGFAGAGYALRAAVRMCGAAHATPQVRITQHQREIQSSHGSEVHVFQRW